MSIRTPPAGPSSILQRNPYADRRSFIARAMALEPIGDIADVSLTENTPTGSLTWETATDWDNAVSETGIVHESVANTDHNDAATTKMGYSIANPYLSTDLVGYWPLHEDAGTTAYDFSGNANDGTTNGGVTVNQTGLLGTSAYSLDAVDDYMQTGSQSVFDLPSGMTLTAWINPDSVSSIQGVISKGKVAGTPGGKDYNFGLWDDGTLLFGISDGSSVFVDMNGGYGSSVSVGTWSFIVATWDGSTAETFINGASNATFSGSGTPTTSHTLRFGGDGGLSSRYFGGGISDLRIYNRALTAAEIQYLYDVVATTDSLTVATKSFSAATKPDLQNLVYTLNTGTISLDVIGSPGTASEEIVTQALDGASSYTLTWANSHTDFRVTVNETVPSFTGTSPTFSGVTLSA